ncbi:hypothetical protein [Pseudoteredinibacter isoporae]|uniref:alpha/beta hydrolase n=1 Tax=Pseudoteredinibacter isoporae TaxID=570281 RepID=UPI00333F89E8
MYFSIFLVVTTVIGIYLSPRFRGKKVAIVSSGLLFLLLLGLAVCLPWQFPVDDLPKPTGPYRVGVSDFELQDMNRKDPFCSGEDCGHRRLSVRVWYPGELGDETISRPYATEEEVSSSLASFAEMMSLPPAVFSHLSSISTHSIEGLGVVKGEKRPVLIFSHGLYSYLWQNTVLIEHLASHGYMIYALHHPYDAAAVEYDDGSITKAWIPEQNSDQLGLQELRRKAYSEVDVGKRFEYFLDYIERAVSVKDSKLLRSAPHWQKDQLFLLKSLVSRDIPRPVQAIVAKGDYKRIAFAGMSFGGSAAMGSCRHSERCVAQINLDGADSHLGGLDRPISAPLLHFYQDHHQQLKNKAPDQPVNTALMFNDFSIQAFDGAESGHDSYQYIVKGSRHFAFTDSSILLSGLARSALVGKPDGKSMMDLQNDFVLAFLDHYMLKKDNGFPVAQENKWIAFVNKHQAAQIPLWWKGISQERQEKLTGRLRQLQEQLGNQY